MVGMRRADLVLFGVTVGELALLIFLTPTFTATDWIYVLQHLMVLGIAITRRAPEAQDRSLPVAAAVAVAYAYPYAQLAYLRWESGDPAWPAGGLVLVTLAACLSFASLATLADGSACARRCGARDEGALPARPPPDVPGLHRRRHRLQPAGMEHRHGVDGAGGLAVGAVPDSRRGASPRARSRLADLHGAGALPTRPRPLVARA